MIIINFLIYFNRCATRGSRHASRRFRRTLWITFIRSKIEEKLKKNNILIWFYFLNKVTSASGVVTVDPVPAPLCQVWFNININILFVFYFQNYNFNLLKFFLIIGWCWLEKCLHYWWRWKCLGNALKICFELMKQQKSFNQYKYI